MLDCFPPGAAPSCNTVFNMRLPGNQQRLQEVPNTASSQEKVRKTPVLTFASKQTVIFAVQGVEFLFGLNKYCVAC